MTAEINRSDWRKVFDHQIPPALRTLRGDHVRADVDTRLERELVERRTDAFAAQFHRACPFPGAIPNDYKQREVELPGENVALMGIRVHYFEEFPFVDVIASTLPVTAANLTILFDAAVEAFDVFQPEVTRVLGPPEPFEAEGLAVNLDQVFVAGLPPKGPADPRVEVDPVADPTAAASFVEREYVAFFRDHPEFEPVIAPSDADAIEVCIETGLAAWLRVDGDLAGFMASRPKVGALIGGHSVTEEILSQQFRGRGLGSIAQRAYLQTLRDTVGSTVVWGTIDARNHASRVTAQRSGRIEHAAWQWCRRPYRP